MRLFIGIGIPSDITARLATLQSGLPGATWVAPDDFHITLRFIGETNRFRRFDLEQELSGLAGAAFDLTIADLGLFNKGNLAHALWAGVQPEPTLDQIQAKVVQACRRAGLPSDERKFKPHITLARFKRKPLDSLADYMAAQDRQGFGAFTVRDIVLYRSHLGASGPHYEALSRFPLTDYAALWPDDDQDLSGSFEPGQ